MIGFFPDIYEDELLYSQLCRYFQRTGYTKYIFAIDDLFMRRSVHPVIEWINEYTPDALAHITRNTDFETIIREHTMFPAYTRFLPKERRAAALHSLLICDGNYHNLIINQSTKCKRYLRYCPACANEDRDQYGETYWHREHQIIHVEVCPKHRCFLKESSIPISSNATPGLFPAELEVPVDELPEACVNDPLIAFSQYMLEVFRSPVDMETDTPIGSFLRSRLDERYQSSSKMRVHSTELYDAYCAFFRSICPLMGFAQFKKVYNNYALDHFQICQLAYFQRIPVEELTKHHTAVVSTAMEEFYRELSAEYGIDFETICKLGEAIISKHRSLGKVSSKSGPKQREWALLDAEYLPRVKALVDCIYSADGKPGRVSISRIEREMGAPKKQFKKLPKCTEYITAHLETQGEYRARQVTWAVKLFLQEGRYLSANKLNHFLCFRRNDLRSCLDHIQDPEVKSVVLGLLAAANRDLE